jgi:WD40 repeat protein
VAANSVFRTAEARDSLLRTLLARPEVRLQFRPTHGRAIGVLVSPDGKTIGTANSDGGGELWDTHTGQLRFELSFENETINTAAFGPDDRVAVVLSNSQTGTWEVVVVDTATGSLLTRIRFGRDTRPGRVAFSRSTLAVETSAGSEPGAIELWDVSGSARLIEKVPVSAPVHALALSPDGTRLAWAEIDFLPSSGRIFVQRLPHGDRLGPLELSLGDETDFGGTIGGLVFSADGRLLESIVPTGEDAIVFWDVDTGSRAHTRSVDSGTVEAASPDQSLVVRRTPAGAIVVEDARTGAPIGAPTIVDPATVGYAYAFTPDVTGLVLVVPDGGIQLIDLFPRTPRLGHQTPVTIPAGEVAILSPDGTLIAISHEAGGFSILDALTGRTIRERSADDGLVRNGRFSARGDLFVFEGDRSPLNVLDVRSGETRQPQLPPDTGFLLGFDVSHDARSLAAIAMNSDFTRARLLRWDLGAGSLIANQLELSGFPQAIAFSPDGTIAVSTSALLQSQGQIELFQPNQASRKLLGHAGTLEFSPDGHTLAVFEGEGVTLLRMPDGIPLGAPLTPNRSESSIMSLAFDVEEGVVATGELDGTIQLWDLGSVAPIGLPLEGHTRPVGSLAFRGEGQLVSLGNLFLGGGEVISWQLGIPSLARGACTRANRELTEGEWTQFIGDAIPYQPPCAAFRE